MDYVLKILFFFFQLLISGKVSTERDSINMPVLKLIEELKLLRKTCMTLVRKSI